MSAMVGRADLLRVLTSDDPVERAALAGLLGYRLSPSQPDPPTVVFPLQLPDFRVPRRLDKPDKEDKTPKTSDIPVWRVVSRIHRDDDDEGESPGLTAETDDDSAEVWKNRPIAAPSWPSLSPRNRLLPRLRTGMTERVPGRAVDLNALVRRIANAQLPNPFPRRRHRRWGASIQVLDDRSRHLTPYWHDQDEVCQWLSRLYPTESLSRARWLPGLEEPIRYTADGIDMSYQPPPPGSLVLVLGDLGCLDQRGSPAVRWWRDFGKRLRAAGCVPVALTPCAADRWPATLRAIWRMVPWEHGTPLSSPEQTELNPEERLLRLVAPAARVEPGLLRHLRQTVLPTSGAALEAAVWQHPAIASPSSVAATLAPDLTPSLRQGFATENDAVQRSVLAILRQWRATLSADVWFEEILSLSPDSRRHLPNPVDLEAAVARFDGFSRRALAFNDPMTRADAMMAVRRLLRRAPSSLDQDPRVGAAFQRLRLFAHQDSLEDGKALPLQSGTFDPRVAPAPSGAAPRRVDLWQSDDGLLATSSDPDQDGVDSLLASVETLNGLVVVGTGYSTDTEKGCNDFWKAGMPPSWALDWGWDEFGAWTCFEIDGVVQRLRWIPPGQFLMGSPDDEPGRSNHEGPQHLVTLSRGYWLFDTACTQALWRAVMGENPSRFTGDDRRPVDSVHWNDVQGFLTRLNARIPGLKLNLPTEAQWENACRAGTTTPFSFGRRISSEQVNHQPRYTYDDAMGILRKGTVPVGSLPPNSWGLYEMHGNLREWCADGKRSYPTEPTTDPRGPESVGTERVLRGGSWRDGERDARAAFRFEFRPDVRIGSIGFRCARVQASPEDAAEPMDPALPRQAERRETQGSAGGVVLRVASGTDSGARCPLPQAPAFHIRTDREELRVERITRPAWANALGRDRFGLWTAITVEPENGGPPVTQSLRWIPPGRFLMGSPGNELRRSDDEGPQHAVTLSRGYWLFDTACPQALWRAVMGKNPSRFKDDDRLPVNRVSWDDVQGFLSRINARVPGLALSLPTEAQWEHACRAGTTTPFSFGATITPEQVNYDGYQPYAGGAKGLYRERTVPVGSLPPNPWGLHEMHGNVWEWCADGMRDYTAQPETDPRGPESADAWRVLRGGCLDYEAGGNRAACRSRRPPDDRYYNIGFRCARVQA